MNVRYTATVDFEIEDKLIEEWAEDSVKFNYPDCIEHNIEECIGYNIYLSDFKDNKCRIHVTNYNDNLNDIVDIAKIRGEDLLTTRKRG